MDKLEYSSQNYNHNSTCAGLIVLQSDEVIEVEVRHWLPNNITLYHTRIPNNGNINEETLAEMHQAIPGVCKLFPEHAPIEVVAYCCTSGATVIGESEVTAAVQEVMPNAKVTNPITAIKARLNDLNAHNIGLLTPYIPAVTEAMNNHLLENGFNIVSAASFYEEQDNKVCRISSSSIKQAIKHVAAKSKCDAIFASCTNLRTVSFLDDMSASMGIPIISSNAALAWHMTQLSDITSAS